MMMLFKSSKIEPFSQTDSIILLGDSILNNSNYVSSDFSVNNLLQRQTRNVYSFARDNDTIDDICDQLDRVSSEFNRPSTYIFISIGGNNILNRGNDNLDFDFLQTLFTQYVTFIRSVQSKFPYANIIILNLYYPLNTYYLGYHKIIDMWNELIEQNQNIGYKILYTNNLITSSDDLTHDIEPSIVGGNKIANAILEY